MVMWRPREKVVILAAPPASRRDNSCFTLGRSRPNRRFFRPTLGCWGFRPLLLFFQTLSTRRYITKPVPSLNITRVSGEPDGRLSGWRPLFTGGTSLRSLQSATVTRLQMSVGKRPGVNALLMTLSRVTLVSFIKHQNKARDHYAQPVRNLGAVLGLNKENIHSAKWGVMGYISVLYAFRCTWQSDVVLLVFS